MSNTDSTVDPNGNSNGKPRLLGLYALLGCSLLAICLFVYLIAGTALGYPSSAYKPTLSGTSSADERLSLEIALDRKNLLRGGDGLVRVELQLKGAALAGPATRQPTDFIVVLDHSGSMADYDKIVHAREAVAGLIDRLEDDDRFGLVIYDDRYEIPIPLAPATPESRRRWKSIVAGVGPVGGTAMSLGLDAGLGVLAERRRGAAARMLLISDGLANQGDTSREGLLGRAAKGADLAAPLTAIGVGNDFDENLMGALADSGGGNFYFLRDAVALAQVFEGELGATRETVAELVEVEVALPAGVELVDAAGYPVEKDRHVYRFRPGSVFAGQERRIWLTLKVGGDVLGTCDLGKVVLGYQLRGAKHQLKPLPTPDVERVADEASYLAGIDRERWGRSVVDEEYGQLRQKVAEHVKAGRRDEAKSEIAAYASKNAALNDKLQNEEVRQNLAETKELEATVDDAFVGADQKLKQNSLSKSNQSAGWDSRRAGAKKLPPAEKPKGGG
jgi:Mg-chelatase subunit ChlD